jgi:hypothetical protein
MNTNASTSARKPFVLGVLVGVVCGLTLGSTLAAIFGDDVGVLARRLVHRITGEREEPNFELLLQ